MLTIEDACLLAINKMKENKLNYSYISLLVDDDIRFAVKFWYLDNNGIEKKLLVNSHFYTVNKKTKEVGICLFPSIEGFELMEAKKLEIPEQFNQETAAKKAKETGKEPVL